MPPTLSLVVPCYNESATLEACVLRMRAIASPSRTLEIVIVDDASSDDSLKRARALASVHPEVKVFAHERNQGKGAALRTGFRHVTGDFVAIQDADLEYDPEDLVRLLEPLERGEADAVLGSRFVRSGLRRVLPFWHSLGNRVLTGLSNAFSNLDLTDMETCYKLFRREVVQSIEIQENRFGFEPEIVAKLAAKRLRIFEAGIRYEGRSVSEGKKIRMVDGLRALYCIARYNAHHAPTALRFAVYCVVASVSSCLDLASFLVALRSGAPLALAALSAYSVASVANHWLGRKLVFPVPPGTAPGTDLLRYAIVVVVAAGLDLFLTTRLVSAGWSPLMAKWIALVPFPILNFELRRRFAFREPMETA